MKFINSFNSNYTKPSFVFLIFYVCFAFWFNDFLKPYSSFKNEHNFVWDGAGYYSYLPAFLQNDFSFESHNYFQDSFLSISDEGRRYPKYTYGVALLEAPFYLIAYGFSYLYNQPLHGYTSIFAGSIRYGCMLYVLIGLIWLRWVLLHYFNEWVTAFTLFAVFFGTMLYNYTFIQSEISHAYLFFLFCGFMYFTHLWHLEAKRKYIIYLSIILAIISVVRATEVFFAIVFIFWEVKSFKDLKSKIFYMLKNYKLFIWIPIICFLFWLPQLYVWKKVFNEYFHYSYVGEGFFWFDPQIWNVLFSFRKGWVTYTPLVLLAFFGILFMKAQLPVSKWVMFFFVAISVYVYSCWWDWNYGGCFGNRAFCQLIAFLSLPIAALINGVLNWRTQIWLKQWSQNILLCFIFLCVMMNVTQSYQYQEQRKIYPFSNSKDIYFASLRRFHYGVGYELLMIKREHIRREEAWIDGFERDDKLNYNKWSK